MRGNLKGAAMNQHVDFREQPTDTPHKTSHEILGGHRKVQIEHAGSVYTLQVTRQGKLLLTK
jgi:hemin uptake protein HemP